MKQAFKGLMLFRGDLGQAPIALEPSIYTSSSYIPYKTLRYWGLDRAYQEHLLILWMALKIFQRSQANFLTF